MEIAIVAFLIGICCGIGFFDIMFHKKSVGTLRVDRSDPTEEPYLFLELTTSVKNVISKDFVTFKVNAKNYIS